MFIRPFALSSAAIACWLVFPGCGGSPLTSPRGSSEVGLAQPPSAADTAAPTATDREVGLAGDAPSALAAAAQELAGTWNCTGLVHGADGAASRSNVSFDVAPALDAAWLRARFVVLSGANGYEFDSYRTFDAASGQWLNIIVDNFGGYTLSRSKDGVIWTGESSGPMGQMTIQDTETIASPGELNLLGQYSLDASGWRTGYELSCKR